MNDEDDELPPEQRPQYDSRPLRLSASPPMWNDRQRGVRGGDGSSSLAPKAPYYISGAILLVAVVIVAFAFFGGSDDEAVQPQAATQPTAAAIEPEVRAPAGPAGNPVAAVAAAVQGTLAKPLLEDCARAEPGRDAGKLCATLRGEREGRRAYAVGPVGAAPTHWYIVENQGGQWAVMQTISLTPDNAGVPGVPWPLRAGAEVVVVGANPCVNVREGPGLNARAVDCIRDGTRITLMAGPTPADGINWWQVQGRSGWVSGDYLRYPDAAQ